MFYEPGKTDHNLPHDPFKVSIESPFRTVSAFFFICQTICTQAFESSSTPPIPILFLILSPTTLFLNTCTYFCQTMSSDPQSTPLPTHNNSLTPHPKGMRHSPPHRLDLHPLPHGHPQLSTLLPIQQPNLRPPLRHVQREPDPFRGPKRHRRQCGGYGGVLLESGNVCVEGCGECDVRAGRTRG